MAILSYRCSEDNVLSFELLVDGQPLGDLIGSLDTVFPYWIVEDGLPRWPPHGPSDAPEIILHAAMDNTFCISSVGLSSGATSPP